MTNFSYKWNLKDLQKVKPNGKTVFSVFAGGGGSSMGYKMAGYDVIGCLEIDPRQIELYKTNLNPKYAYCEDIRDFIKREVLPKELYELDVLDASPPCSLFSSANLKADDKKGKKVKFREGQVEQTLDDLFFETIKLIDKLKPKVAIMENVKGLLHQKNKWYVEQIYKQLHDIGYKVTHKLINAADCGVPQKRQRVFFIAIRNDIEIETADLYGEEPKINLDFNEKHITIGDIDHDDKGKKPTEHILKLMKHYKKGDTSLRDIRKRIDGKTTGFQTYIVKDSDICNTLRAISNDFIQVDRGFINFSDYELIQLGSFPLDYDFVGAGYSYIIGMSVPPLMMCRVSKAIYEQILRGTK
jgi:DNA (cytosine-5)-methyltransferase 1